MEFLAYFVPPEKHYGHKSSFHKEGNDAFNGKWGSEDITYEPRIVAPVRTELEFENQSGSYSDGKIDSEQSHPETGCPFPEIMTGNDVPCLHNSHDDSQSQREPASGTLPSGRIVLLTSLSLSPYCLT